MSSETRRERLEIYRQARKRWRAAVARFAAARRNPMMGVAGSEQLNDLAGARDSSWLEMATAALALANTEDKRHG